MKTRSLIIAGCLLLSSFSASSKEEGAIAGRTGENPVTVSSSPELKNLVATWAAEYNRQHPDAIVRMTEVSGGQKGLNDPGNISFLEDASSAAVTSRDSWTIVVGRTVIVPVISRSNPNFELIRSKGLSPASLAALLGEVTGRGNTLDLGDGHKIPVKYYSIGDPVINEGIRSFSGSPAVNNAGIHTGTGQGMKDAIAKDPLGLGFCRLSDLAGNMGNIAVAPIDRNGNHRIDFMENIYGSLEDLSRGVWIGKYPKSLSVTIYAVAGTQPENSTSRAFLGWVLNQGQDFMAEYSYTPLVGAERNMQAGKLTGAPALVQAPAPETRANWKNVLMIVASILLLGFMTDIMGRYYRGRRQANPSHAHAASGPLTESSLDIPSGLFFDRSHTWTFMERNGLVRTGLDDFIQHVTGTITRVEMKNPGDRIRKGERMFTVIHKGKHLGINSPVTGVISARNEMLATDPSAINRAPYADGWIYLIEPANWTLEMQFLTLADKYRDWLKGEFTRLKDFVATSMAASTPAYRHIVLQDGGELADHLLEDLDPEVWEDFQSAFLDQPGS